MPAMPKYVRSARVPQKKPPPGRAELTNARKRRHDLRLICAPRCAYRILDRSTTGRIRNSCGSGEVIPPSDFGRPVPPLAWRPSPFVTVKLIRPSSGVTCLSVAAGTRKPVLWPASSNSPPAPPNV